MRRQLDRRVRAKVIQRDGRTCAYCGSDVVEGPPGPYRLTIDHRIPLARGGTDHLDNLVVACFSCNCRKHARDADEFMATLTARSDHSCSEGCPEMQWLCGVAEITHILGLSRQRVDQLSREPGFPDPHAVISNGRFRIWLTEDIWRWVRDREPKTA